MKDNVFWSVIGVILVAWLASMFFLGWQPMGEFNEKSKKLGKSVKSLKNFSEMKANALPTAELEENEADYLKRLEEDVAGLKAYYADRDAQFEELLSPSIGSWNTQYQVEFTTLSREYQAKTGQELIIRAVNPPTKSEALPSLQKRWNVQKSVARTVMGTKGAHLSNMDAGFKVRRRSSSKKTNKGGTDKFFATELVKFEVRMPATSVTAFMEALRADPKINFELNTSIVAKLPGKLIRENIELNQDSKEPYVLVRFEYSVRDWNFVEPKEKSTDEDDS